MPLNSYFQNFTYQPEQTLIENLGIEMIKMFGLDIAYIRRSHVNIDPLFLEDPLSQFQTYSFIEMYIKDYMGYGQLSDIMSKFGSFSPDTLTLSLMRKRFFETFPSMTRPLEGDLVYIPMVRSLFEIKYVEHEDLFYESGHLQYFDIKCERFVYSSETLETGDPDIDIVQTKYSDEIVSNLYWTTESNLEFTTEDGQSFLLENDPEIGDGKIDTEDNQTITLENGESFDLENIGSNTNLVIQNSYFDRESNTIIDFSEVNPFGGF